MNFSQSFFLLSFTLLHCYLKSIPDITIFPYSFLGYSEEKILSVGKKSFFRPIEAVVLHNTKNLNIKEYFEKSIQNRFMSHYIIDKEGNIYGFDFPEKIIFQVTPSLDYSAIHISVEGNFDKITKNQKIIQSLGNLFFYLSQKYNIQISNYNINSKKGFFTHTQAKKKFGHFISLDECGGEEVLKKVFENFRLKYYSEIEWKNRSKGWISIYNKKLKSKKRKYRRFKNEGRRISPTPVASLLSIEKSDGFLIEKHRLQYTNLGNIPATCIVLHYTASSNFTSAFETLENSNLSATFMVDVDGKIVQLLDQPNKMAITASGTNEHCIQIEIVGLNTEKLIENKIQFYKVVELLQELTHKYNIPKNNYKIESFKGIFSHTQAKKRWGYSVMLKGKDFDPGEEYMKLILEAIGGKYYPERQWFNRNQKYWKIWDGDFEL